MKIYKLTTRSTQTGVTVTFHGSKKEANKEHAKADICRNILTDAVLEKIHTTKPIER